MLRSRTVRRVYVCLYVCMCVHVCMYVCAGAFVGLGAAQSLRKVHTIQAGQHIVCGHCSCRGLLQSRGLARRPWSCPTPSPSSEIDEVFILVAVVLFPAQIPACGCAWALPGCM